MNANGVVMSSETAGSLTPEQADAVLGITMLSTGQTIDGLSLSRIAKEIRHEGFDRSTDRWAAMHTGITLFSGPSAGGGIGQPPPLGT